MILDSIAPYGYDRVKTKSVPTMDEPTNSRSNPFKRFLGSPVWDGISGVLAIVGFILTLRVLWELVTSNVRLLLWLQATTYAVPILIAILLIIFLGAAYIFFAWRTVKETDLIDNSQHAHRERRYSRRSRRVSLFLGLSAVALALIVTVGFTVWSQSADDTTFVLIADFLDPNGHDSMAVTRELVDQIGDIVADFPDDIQIRTLGWPIEDRRGEGSIDARHIGQLAKADIVIWGDYRIDPDIVTYVHFDLLNNTQPLLKAESYRVYGNDQIQQVAAAQQQLSMPKTVAFNVTLGEHLGALVAFAGSLALSDSGTYSESARLLDTASQIYGNPLAVQIEPAIHFMRGSVYLDLNDASVPW